MGWFQGGTLFIDLHGYDDAPVQPGQALDALLRALGVTAEQIPPSTEERAGLYRSTLAATGSPILIVADNASSEAQLRPLLPGLGPHRVVVTSRHTLAGLGGRLVDVMALDEAAAVTLLDAALRDARPEDDRIGDDRAAAARLAGICGGLPLALQIAAALLKADPTRTAGDLADELGNEVRRLEALRYDDGGGISAPSVGVAFELSYRRLDEAAARVFRLLPVNPGPDASTAALAALTDMPVGEARAAIGQLVQAHLLETAAGSTGRWRMHDLLRLYASQLSDVHADRDGREQARDRLLHYYLNTATLAAWSLWALPGELVPVEFSSRDSALAWLDAERPSLVAAVTTAANTGQDQIVIQLLLQLGRYLSWRRRFDDLLSAATLGRDAARRRRDRRNEAVALINLGLALRDVHRSEEAVTACHDAAAIYRKLGDQQGEGIALTNLSSALQEAGQFKKAVIACHEAAAIYRKLGDQHGEGSVLINLALAHGKEGRIKESILTLQDAVTIFRELGDPDSEGRALSNIGLTLLNIGWFEKAVDAYHDAITIFRETGDRHAEATALRNRGIALRKMGRLEEAITAHHDAAAIFQEIGDHQAGDMARKELESDQAAQQA